MYKGTGFFRELKDIYLGYRYKWMDVTSKTIPVPYFSRKEISDHEFKMTYQEWKKVIVCYLKNVFEYIVDGNTFPVPHKLGYLYLTKTKRKLIDRKKTGSEGKLVAKRLLHTYNYKPRVCWNTSRCDMPYKTLYKCKLVRTLWSKLMESYVEDGSQIMKLKDNRLG
jgi:hypothetical protein